MRTARGWPLRTGVAVLAAVATAGCAQTRLVHRQVVTTSRLPGPPAVVTEWVVPEGASLVGLVRPATVTVRTRPDPAAPAPWRLANPNDEGAPLVFLVLGHRAGWVEVSVPARPDGSTGWVPAGEVTLRVDPYRLTVSESAHRLTVLKDGRPVAAYPVAVGAPYAPTPVGSFYLTELLHSPGNTGPYGPWAYGTSAFSGVYSEFEGGPGQIGLHGTDEPWSIGRSASHGCIRMFDADIARLAAYVPVGTPVVITG